MATPAAMHVAPANTGLLGVPQTEDTARVLNALLQEDLEVRFDGAVLTMVESHSTCGLFKNCHFKVLLSRR
jgi:hypothetical protein